MKLIIKAIKVVSDILDIICRKLCLVIGIVLVVDLFLGCLPDSYLETS